MPKPPYFPCYVNDFAADPKVEAMDTAEVGAYFLLLLKAWKEEPAGTVPNDDKVLARWARVSYEQWEIMRESVMAPWKLQTDNRWHQKRMEQEWESMMSRRERRAKAGREAMNRRWGNNVSSRNQRFGTLITKSPFTLNLWRQMSDYFSGACLGCGASEEVLPVLINPEGNNNITNVQPLCRECFGSGAHINKDLRVGKVKESKLREKWGVEVPREKEEKARRVKFDAKRFTLNEAMRIWIDTKYPEFVQGDIDYMITKFKSVFHGKLAVSWRLTFYTFVDNEVTRYKYRPGDFDWRNKNGGQPIKPSSTVAHDELQTRDRQELEEFERELAAADEGPGAAGGDSEDFFLVPEDDDR